jgi:hypothetical protein
MELTLDEFKKLNELEYIISVVINLSKILDDYSGNKEFLIEILLEKSKIMENTLEDFISLLEKKDM